MVSGPLAITGAAARPLHWIYDQQELDTLLEGRDEVEFWPESKVDRDRIM